MSESALGRAREADAHQGSQHPSQHLDFLDPNSYTAHRLHHATAPHLHITTRRVFVGPVPKGWLKNHRGEWYKHHLHLNYSRKQATFTPGAEVDAGRRVTNLQLPVHHGRDVEDGEDLIDVSEAIGDTSEPRPIPRATHLTDDTESEQGNENAKTFQTAASARRTPIDVIQFGPAKGRYAPSIARTPGFERGESWQTASESFGGRSPRSPGESGPSNWQNAGSSTRHSPEPEDDTTFQSDGTNNIPRRPTLYNDLHTEEPVPIPSGSEFGGSSVTPPSIEAANSLASLLIHDEARRKKAKSPPNDQRPSRSLLKTPSFLSPAKARSRTQSQTPDLGPKVSTNNDRVTGGMVRFNTAVQLHERDKQLQLKLAELSRRRTLRHVGHSSCFRRRDGEIIKMENMLVRVDCAKAQLPDDYDEHESIRFDLQAIERWREFIVVCREGSSEEMAMCIQLYKSRTVPAIDRKHVSSRSTLTIPLIPRATHVNLYSSLDKSLVIWHQKKSWTMIYILRPRCTSSSVEWYTFLRKALGWHRPESLQIYVPDMNVNLTIANPFDKVEKKLSEGNGREGDRSLLEEEKAIAGDIIQKSMNLLRDCHLWDALLDKWTHHEKVGLAWRKYDRLEWVHGVNEQRMYGTIGMQKTHVLELRPKIHYPTETSLPSDEILVEPPPVEGFLVRLSRGAGRNRQYGNLYFAKRYYWTTHDHLFCFCRPARALPPPPPKLPVHQGFVPPTSQIIDKIPLIYGVAPYELNEQDQIKWLDNGNEEYLEKRDLDAYGEAERKVNTLLRAEGFIDLTKVERVELIRRDATDEMPNSSIESPTTDTNWQDDSSDDTYHDKVFMLALSNGLNVKFQTYDKETRDEWVKRLRDLVVYWKARHLEDMTLVQKTRNMNLKELHIDEEMEALVGEHARKWEVSHALASPVLYNTCGLSSCRAITMSGDLYRKPRKHSTFVKYHVVLCHGELIIFHSTTRARTGTSQLHIHHERHSSVSLQDCYIYSGTLTKLDLVYEAQSYDTNGPIRHALPRIYEDGLTSQDDDSMLCFVLWHGRRNGFKVGTDGQGNTVHTIGTKLGMGMGGGGGIGGWGMGKAMVFKAPTRVHRDVWVVNIAMEIERLHTKAFEDIKIKP